MTQEQHQLFAALVEMMATGNALAEDGTPRASWQNGFNVFLENIVLESGGSMDDEWFVDHMKHQLAELLTKKMYERHAVLVAQAQAA